MRLSRHAVATPEHCASRSDFKNGLRKEAVFFVWCRVLTLRRATRLSQLLATAKRPFGAGGADNVHFLGPPVLRRAIVQIRAGPLRQNKGKCKLDRERKSSGGQPRYPARHHVPLRSNPKLPVKISNI